MCQLAFYLSEYKSLQGQNCSKNPHHVGLLPGHKTVTVRSEPQRTQHTVAAHFFLTSSFCLSSPAINEDPVIFFHLRSRSSSHWQFTQGLKVLFRTPEIEGGLQSGLTNPLALSHSLCPPKVTKAIRAFFSLLFGHLTMPKIASCSTVNLRRSWPWCWEITGRKQK